MKMGKAGASQNLSASFSYLSHGFRDSPFQIFQCLLQIGNQVVCISQSHRQAKQRVRNTQTLPYLLRNVRMGLYRGIGNQRFGAAIDYFFSSNRITPSAGFWSMAPTMRWER